MVPDLCYNKSIVSKLKPKFSSLQAERKIIYFACDILNEYEIYYKPNKVALDGK